MLNIVIIEDTKEDLIDLERILDKYAVSHNETIHYEAFGSAEEYISSPQKKVDIIFFDIELPGMNGMELAKKIREIDEEVYFVFITNVLNYAVEGYSVGAIGYLIKKVTLEKMTTLLDEIKKINNRKRNVVISVSGTGVTNFIDSREIIYIESIGHNLIYHLVHGKIEGWGSLKKEEEKLSPFGFARCKSGYLVNFSFVTNIKKDCVVLNDISLPFSKNMKDEFLLLMNQYFSR